jgi:hypothetical protein
MAFVVNDRVQEFTSTTGTGTLTLTGSPDGFETFSSAVGNGNTTYYTISSNTTEFEVGIGTVGAGTLSRDTVISSSNSDALVNFSAGTKNVFVTLPASKTILLNDSDTVDLTGNLDLNSNDITGTGNINITGSLTASGNLTSLGIDDNATSTAITINSSEQVEFTAGTVSLPSITTTGDTNTGIFFPAADTIGFAEGGVEAMRIDSSGRVGIGTSSPANKLSVAQNDSNTVITNGNSNIELSNINGTNNTYSRIIFNDTVGGAGAAIFGVKLTDTTNNYGQFEFWTRGSSGGSTRMVIDPNGNVGIGTSSPSSKLDVNGAVNIAATAWLTFGSKNTLFSSTSVAGLIIQSPTAGSENIIFRTSTGAERMRINNSNYVGIGTPSPDALLSVNGVASFGDGTALLPSIANFGDLNTGMWFPAADTIAFSEGGVEAMRIDSSGNVGIGTSSPSHQQD